MSFWQTKSLSEMSTTEWESLCDSCAKCCLHKLEDEDTGEVFHTDVVCRLLDLNSCQCRDYEDRFTQVPVCFKLTPDNLHHQTWLPASCAYRLLFEGKTLPEWHHLVSGNNQSVHISGNSIKGKAVMEQSVQLDDMEHRIVHWID
jgi:uncharacterized cysteine cluster protein YcgN (CxxCxxCC family)